MNKHSFYLFGSTMLASIPTRNVWCERVFGGEVCCPVHGVRGK